MYLTMTAAATGWLTGVTQSEDPTFATLRSVSEEGLKHIKSIIFEPQISGVSHYILYVFFSTDGGTA